MNDLTAVIRRFVSQAKVRKDTLVPPVKITRAVGLQVNVITTNTHVVHTVAVRNLQMENNALYDMHFTFDYLIIINNSSYVI